MTLHLSIRVSLLHLLHTFTFHVSFAVLRIIQVKVLLLYELLQLVDLLAVQVHSHLVRSCDQIRMYLHVHVTFILLAVIHVVLLLLIIHALAL